MLKKPTYTGVENIMSGFDSLNPDAMFYYSLWHGVDDIAFQCTSSDPAQQKEMLENYIASLEKAGNSELMYLKLHPNDITGYISKKTPVAMVTPIQIVETQDLKILSGESPLVARPQGMSFEAWNMLKGIQDLPATIGSIVDERLKALLDEEEETEPEENEVQKYIGIIKGVTQDPTIMAVIGQLFNFLKPQPNYVAPGRIGMTEQSPNIQQSAPPAERQPIACNEDQMNEALSRLQFHCDLGNCLMRLANMADANPAGFQHLLQMLPQ